MKTQNNLLEQRIGVLPGEYRVRVSKAAFMLVGRKVVYQQHTGCQNEKYLCQ